MTGLTRKTRLAAVLFATLVVTYSWPRDLDTGPNINAHLSQALAIAVDGTLAIDNYANSSATFTIDWARAPNGHLYPAKAPGCALALTPVVWIVSIIERRLGHDPVSGGAVWRKAILANWLLNAWPSAACMVLLFMLMRGLGLSDASACAGTAAVALGTPYYPYATAFYAHAPAANLIIIAALAIFRRNGGAWLDAVAGLSVGVAVVFDYPAVIAVMTSAAALCALRPRGLLPFAAGGLVPLAVLLTYHWVTLGSPIATPYAYQNPEFVPPSGDPFGGPDPRIFMALLFSPYRGLFYFSPVTLAAIPGAVLLWRQSSPSRDDRRDRRRIRIYVLFAAATLGGWLLLNSSYFTWHGGHTTGPRFIIPAIVLLGPLIACAWSRFTTVVSGLLVLSVMNQGAIAAVWLMVPDTYRNPLMEVIYPQLVAGTFVRGNLGMRFGLSGIWSIVPLVALWTLAIVVVRRRCFPKTADSAGGGGAPTP